MIITYYMKDFNIISDQQYWLRELELNLINFFPISPHFTNSCNRGWKMFTSGWQPFLHTRNPGATLQTHSSWYPTSGILTAAFGFEVWLIWCEVGTLVIKNKTSQVLPVLLGLPLYLNIVLTFKILCFMPLDTIYLFKWVNLLKGWWQTRGTSPRPRHCHCFQHLISFVSVFPSRYDGSHHDPSPWKRAEGLLQVQS